jgi:5,10-methylene-tetrahydrofolate dehydrogenase/methenyl tetrahydrofolate cyclohydrolase
MSYSKNSRKDNKQPVLATILVGDNPASVTYVAVESAEAK